MKTVKVRIAVAVDRDGNWSAFGCNEHTDKVDMNYAVAGDESLTGRYFVEAELPIPTVPTVQGTVVEEKR